MAERQLPSSRAFASALPRTRSATSVASAPYGVRRNPFQTQLSRNRTISASARMRYDYDDDDDGEEQDGLDDEDESLDVDRDEDEDDESYEQQRYYFHNRHRFLHGFRSHGELGRASGIEKAFPPHHQYALEVKRPSPETDDIVVRDEHGEIELEDPPTPPPPEMDEASRAALEARHENELERQRLAEAVKQHQMDQNSMLAQAEEGKDYYLFPDPDPDPFISHSSNGSDSESTAILMYGKRLYAVASGRERSHSEISSSSQPSFPSFPSFPSSSSASSDREPQTKTKPYASTTELLEAVKASLRQKVAALAEDNWMFEREELPHHQ